VSVAQGLHFLLYSNASKTIKSSYTFPEVENDAGNLLVRALINNVTFLGVSGNVSFGAGELIHGRASADLFGRGDRYSGLTYRPVSYNSKAIEFQNWPDVGRWDTEGEA